MKLPKIKWLKTNGMLKYALAGTLALLVGACNGAEAEVTIPQTEPRIVVVTATPLAEGSSLGADRPTEVTVGGGSVPVLTVAESPSTPVYEAGTLLKGSGEGVFYLTADDTRLHIYDWDTFLAFGFAPQAIVEVQDEVLQAWPISGELTRLLESERGQLYWVIEGQRLRLNTSNLWLEEAARIKDFGVPTTNMEIAMAHKTLPLRAGFERGTLLRADGGLYYYNLGRVIPVDPQAVELGGVVDVPFGVIQTYAQQSVLSQLLSNLNDETKAANLRSGPGVGYEVVDVIERDQQFAVSGQADNGAWLQVSYQNQSGWLARDLIADTVAVTLLPTVQYAGDPPAELPQAEPAAITQAPEPVVEEPELQPLICTDVPIRGFGAVWGDQVAVQYGLGCPTGWPGGEQATNAAVQTFERGLMLWLEADSTYSGGDPVYVFFNDGTFQRFGDLGVADADTIKAIPAGFYEIGDKFSKVYWEGTGARVKERLGYATSEAADSAGAFQQFSRGRMFWAEAADEIFVIYDYSYYDEQTEQSIRVRTWQSFVDRF